LDAAHAMALTNVFLALKTLPMSRATTLDTATLLVLMVIIYRLYSQMIKVFARVEIFKIVQNP
jgi:hypothetical protein